MYLVHFLGKLAGKASHEGNLSWLCLDAVLEAVGLFPFGNRRLWGLCWWDCTEPSDQV